MSYMNIVKRDDDSGKYEVNYVVDHKIGNAIVDEKTAQLLERAKEAGASERMAEIRKLLEFSW